ncbi:MAG: hypothetical protein ACLQVY_19900 [Limisphaerales bacterium]
MAQSANLFDSFEADSNLDTSIWTNQSGLLTLLAAESSVPNSVFVAPVLTFGGSGMKMAGVNGTYQFTGIQSLSPIAPPFTLTTTVTATGGDGTEFEVYLVSSDLSQVLGVAGSVASNGIVADYGQPLHGAVLEENLNNRLPYTIRMALDTNGAASVLLSDTNALILAAKGGLPIGIGPFYIVLAQRNASQSGSESAVWQDVDVTPAQPLLPPQPSVVTVGGISYADFHWAELSCCATFDGIGPVLKSGSELSVDADTGFYECGALCVLSGFSATVVLGALSPGPHGFITTSWGVPVFTNNFTVPANPTPTLQPIGFTSDGTFEMQLNGVADVSYVLQSSTDLIHWTSLSTNSAGQTLTDSPSASPGWGFYRVLIPEPVAFSGFPP